MEILEIMVVHRISSRAKRQLCQSRGRAERLSRVEKCNLTPALLESSTAEDSIYPNLMLVEARVPYGYINGYFGIWVY